MYKADQNSSMHSVVRHSIQNLTILHHWQYHRHILALRHRDWYRRNEDYTNLHIHWQYQNLGKSLSHDQYVSNHLAQVENVSRLAWYDLQPNHR